MTQEHLSQAHLAELEQITARFTSQWKSGSRPRVKEFASTASLPARHSLLLELIGIDVDYRRRAGETPTIDDYREFTELTPVEIEMLTTGNLNRTSPIANSAKEDAESVSNNLTMPRAPADRFKKIKEIGRGGMGAVWRAIQMSTGREVALKELPANILNSARARARFEEEIHWASQMQHPNIARVYDSGLLEGSYFYAMELIQGEHLDEYAKNKKWTLRQMLEMMSVIAKAVQYAHERNILHRDLKPSNIMVTSEGKPIIVDFGLACLVRDTKSKTKPQYGDVIGTPAFMAPEQALGREDLADRQTDIYSLGVIIYHFVTGVFPHSLNPSFGARQRQFVEEKIRPPSEINHRIGKDLDALIMKCLAFNPTDRYAEALHLAADIDRLLKGQELQARPLNWIGKVKSWCGRPNRLAQVSNLSISIGAILAPFHIIAIGLGIAEFCGVPIPGFDNLRFGDFIELMTGFLCFDAWLFFTGFMVRRKHIWPLWINAVVVIALMAWFIVVLLGIVKFDTGGAVSSMAVRLPVYLIFMGFAVVGFVAVCLAINAHHAQAFLDNPLVTNSDQH